MNCCIFMFYDYAVKEHHDLFNRLDTESGIFWDVAEIFNSVVLNLNAFSKIHGFDGQVTYPEHKKTAQILSGEYKDIKDIDEFIVRIYNLVKQE